MSVPLLQTEHQRLRDDTTALNTDGGWLAAQNTNYSSIALDTTYRLRQIILEINGKNGEFITDGETLQYRRNTGTWTNLGDGNCDLAASTHIGASPNDVCSTQLLTEAANTWDAEGPAADSGQAFTANAYAKDTKWETEHAFQLPSTGVFADTDTLEFRFTGGRMDGTEGNHVKIVLTVDAGSGPTEESAPVTNTHTEAASRELSLGRTASTTHTSTEAASRELSLDRAAAVTHTATAGASIVKQKQIQADTTHTSTAGASRQATFPRTAATTHTGTAAASRELSLDRQADTTHTITEDASRIATFPRTASTTHTSTAAASTIKSKGITAATTHTATAAASRALSLDRTASTTHTSTAAADRQATFSRTASTTHTSTAAAARELALDRSAAVSHTITVGAAAQLIKEVTAAVTHNITAAASRLLSLNRDADTTHTSTVAASRELAIDHLAAVTHTLTAGAAYELITSGFTEIFAAVGVTHTPAAVRAADAGRLGSTTVIHTAAASTILNPGDQQTPIDPSPPCWALDP